MSKKRSSAGILMPVEHTYDDIMDQVKLAKRDIESALGHLSRASLVYRNITEGEK